MENKPGERQSEAANPTKKAYHKPEFRFEPVFEVSALSCGKLQDTGGNCVSLRNAS